MFGIRQNSKKKNQLRLEGIKIKCVVGIVVGFPNNKLKKMDMRAHLLTNWNSKQNNESEEEFNSFF